jgi:hypothetical protein
LRAEISDRLPRVFDLGISELSGCVAEEPFRSTHVLSRLRLDELVRCVGESFLGAIESVTDRHNGFSVQS